MLYALYFYQNLVSLVQFRTAGAAYRALELLRADPNIPTHSVTLLDALTEDGSRADLARIQNPARAARALTYLIHR